MLRLFLCFCCLFFKLSQRFGLLHITANRTRIGNCITTNAVPSTKEMYRHTYVFSDKNE